MRCHLFCITAQVPFTAAMAVQLRDRAKHEEDERAEIKHLVLKANKDLDLAGSAGPLQPLADQENAWSL